MKKQLLFLFLLVGYLGFSQGITTSSINGRILDANQEALMGATVLAVHTPSGTQYGVVTDFNGFYRIPNMRVGGPYSITITYVGFENIVMNDVYLQLGDSETINRQMSETASALDEVVISITRNSIFDSNQTGSNTNISAREINSLPTVTRSLGDFVRKTPEAQVSEDGAISLGGQNNRYNSIYVDGAVNNDVFGLAASGTNGGQTGVSPISLDAIESFQVNLAPFDVRQSGFAGGSINAITRAGTNSIEGSAYYFFRNQNLAGLTPTAINEDDRTKLSEFTAKTYGGRVGGAIIENKLFYFVNYERQEEQTPQPFDIANYRGDSSLQELNDLRQGLISRFGYDPGVFNQNTRELNSHKLIARVDWNINDKNSIIFKNSYVESENIGPRTSGNTTINFFNSGVFFPSKTNSTTLEWNTTNNSNMSNNLILGYTTVTDDRDPLGDPFPRVRIDDGSGSIFFGSEPFSTANLLEQKLFTITNNFEYYSGRHKFTLGANAELFDVKNVFFGLNFGEYRYFNLQDFMNVLDGQDVTPRNYTRRYSLIGGQGDESLGAAEFKYNQFGVYLQDEIQMSDNFKLSLGMRIDIPTFEDGLANDDFNNRTVGLLEAAGKDLQGARVGKSIESNIHYSPRIGFNWDVHGDRTTQIRGGVGVFTSRVPLVWPGGTYSNNGVSQGEVRDSNLGQPAYFIADPFNQYVRPGQEPGSGVNGGNIDLFAPGFKLPQVLKYNFAIDQRIPIWGLIGTAEFLYNDVLNAVYYENLNVKGPVGNFNGADNRPFYNRNDLVDPTYGFIILGSNTDKGFSYNATMKLTKPFQNGFSGQIAYTFGESKSIFEGTSSQNSSQWRNIQTVNGKNSFLEPSRSDFALGSRFSGYASYELSWSENVKTTFSLFYSGEEGNAFSYVYNGSRILNDDSTDRALIYVPRDASEITFRPIIEDGVVIATPAQQWNAFNAFIEGDSHLRNRRGNYAQRNGSRADWSHILDFKIMQDFGVNIGSKTHSFQASLDVFNFTNLINKDWGRRSFVPSNLGILRAESGGPNPEFTFDERFLTEGINEFDDVGILSSRWQVQLGIRYTIK
jgi:hypothetical protein